MFPVHLYFVFFVFGKVEVEDFKTCLSCVLAVETFFVLRIDAPLLQMYKDKNYNTTLSIDLNKTYLFVSFHWFVLLVCIYKFDF